MSAAGVFNYRVKEQQMGTSSNPVSTGDVQNQANQLMDEQTKLTEINFQVQQSTATFQTSTAVTAQAGTAAAQAAQHIGSAGRA
jgi:hypothetical protein